MRNTTVNPARATRRGARRRRSPWLLMGAFVASAAVTGRPASLEASGERRSDRYTDAMSDVLGHRGIDLSFPPSWEMALDAVRKRVSIAPPPKAWQQPAPVTPARQDPPAIQFDIAAGPLETVLASFQTITGLKVVLADEAIALLQSPGVKACSHPSRRWRSCCREPA
jgi:hypothetical protein